MIGRLTLSDFRNHADALILPDHAFVLLTGDNGAGKTNILEAVSMLAPGRGLRGAARGAMARQDGRGGFGIAAEVDGVVLGTGVQAAAPERRQVRIGGVAASANALADHLSIVWLTPAMDRLFLDSPGGRRRFLDRLTLALHPGHAAHSARYDAAMRARNRLLSDLRSADPAWLSALEAQMGDHGAALSAARADLVERLNGGGGSGGATRRPGGRCRGRIARTWRSSMRPRGRRRRCVRPGSRRRCCYPSCWPMPGWSRRIVASRRCCCSTKWRRISTRCAGPPCSNGWPKPGGKCG